MAKIIDIDSQLPVKPDAPTVTQPVRLFGQEWDVVCDVNSFTLASLLSGEVQAYTEFLLHAVVDEQQAAMRRVLTEQRGLDPERLAAIVNALVEVMAERPTVSPSASSRTASKRTSSRKSTAASSSARAARIAR